MGRSVSYINGADAIAYLSPEFSEDEFDAQIEWDDFVDYIKETLKGMFPSLDDVDEGEDETNIILENSFVEIGISEYCGLVSVSWRNQYWGGMDCIDCAEDRSKCNLATRWIEQNRSKFLSIGELVKVGTFSNGEAVFERKSLKKTGLYNGTE